MRISDWSSDVCSSDLGAAAGVDCPDAEGRALGGNCVSAYVAALKTVRPELVEGPFFFATSKEEQCFDQLSTNGDGAVWNQEAQSNDHPRPHRLFPLLGQLSGPAPIGRSSGRERVCPSV